MNHQKEIPVARSSSPLPVRLQYLEPVRKQLAALPPGEVHEYTDLSVLRKAVRKRIKGLSEAEVAVALQQDTEELERWLAAGGVEHVHLHFLLPLLPDAVELLLREETPTPPERGEVSMDLPAEAKVSKENGCWAVQWQREMLSLFPFHEEDLLREIGQFRENARRQPLIAGEGTEVEEVQFGPVSGVKRTLRGTQGKAKYRRLDYALIVPDGHLMATLQSTARKFGDFDETEIEAYFHTLKILNYPSKSLQK